jgi:DNA-binding MarR family transcriptional regulator
MLLSMKRAKRPRPPGMVDQVEQFIDVVFWPICRVLDREGITTLHWAFLQRAYRAGGSVHFGTVLQATRESKDNVRRAAAFLEKSRLGVISVDPSDRRARIFTLTPRGEKITTRIRGRFEANLLKLVGAREAISQRVRAFTNHLWKASGFLPPGDLTSPSRYCKADLPDDSARFAPEEHPAGRLEPAGDRMPW